MRKAKPDSYKNITPEPEPPKQERPRMFLAVMGRCWLADKKKGYHYMPVKKEDDGEFHPILQAESRAYGPKPLLTGTVGAVFSVEYDKDKPSSVFPSTAIHSGRIKDQALLEEWQLDNGRVTAEQESSAKMSQPIQSDLDELIAKIQNYNQKHPYKRRAVLAYLLAKLW